MSVINNFPVDETYNLPAEVDVGKDVELSFGNMQFKARKENMVTPYQTLIGRFYHILTPYIVTKEYTEKEYWRYYQKPRLLSYDLYGTPELWSGLLYINNMVSTAKFTKQSVKVFTTGIIEALQEIMTIYYDDLEQNRTEVYPDEEDEYDYT